MTKSWNQHLRAAANYVNHCKPFVATTCWAILCTIQTQALKLLCNGHFQIFIFHLGLWWSSLRKINRPTETVFIILFTASFKNSFLL